MPSICEFFIENGLFTAKNHCNLGSGSIVPPDRSAVATFCLIGSSAVIKFCDFNQLTIISRASVTFLPSSSSPALFSPTVILANSFMTGLIGKPCRSAISASIRLCAGVTPKAPVPKSFSTLSSATILICSGTPANSKSYSFPTNSA